MVSENSANAERAPLLGPKPLKNDHDSSEHQDQLHTHITRKLYTSHFLSTWNSRVFEFGSILYLAIFFPGTMVPMSLYALARGLSAFVFAPIVGSYIDTANRLQVVRFSIGRTTYLSV
jgi:solute carrier family 40 (iron-regulated transporter), member 1